MPHPNFSLHLPEWGRVILLIRSFVFQVNENITQDKDDTGSDTSSELLFYGMRFPCVML